MRHLLLILMSLLTSSVVFAEPPTATKSDYLVTESAGFVGDSNKGGGFKFSIMLAAGELLKEKRYATASFENPEDENNAIVVDFEIDPTQSIFIVSSPDAIHRWKNNYRYTIQVSIFEDQGRTKLLGTHTQKLDFAIPQKVADIYQITLL
jgi:hypothetical protein